MSFCFLFIAAAALFASLTSLALSKTIYRGGAASGYLFSYFLSCFLVSLLLNGITFSPPSFSIQMAGLGVVVGLIVAALMFALGKAIKYGPRA